jgi:hypothetical protein
MFTSLSSTSTVKGKFVGSKMSLGERNNFIFNLDRSWGGKIHYVVFSSFIFKQSISKHYSKGKQLIYRGIHKSLRDFRPLRYSSRDGHAEGEHGNRGRDTPSFCPTLQRNACRRNLITGLTSAASPRVHISSIYKVGQKLEVSLPLLPCSPSA